MWVGVLTRRVPTVAVGDPFMARMRDFFRHRTGERVFARCGHDLSDRPGPRFSAVPLRSVMSKSGQSLPPADACFATRDVACLAVVGGVRDREPGVVRSARAPHRAMRRGCQGDTIEMPAEYDRVSVLVKLNRTSCVPAITQVPGPGTARSRGQRPTKRHP